MDVKELLNKKEYDFLRTNQYLGNNICLLTLGGSRAYGTNLPTSDVDVRGIAISPTKQLFDLEPDFEQVVDIDTDTTIYSLSKMVKLLLSCNPNTIEILGCRPQDYLYVNEIGQRILDNANNFLSIRAIDTFGGYANAQYNRLEHGLLGNGENDDKKLLMLQHSLTRSIESFNAMHKTKTQNLTIRILSDEELKEVLDENYNKEKDLLLSQYNENKKVAGNDESKIQSLNDVLKNNLYSLNLKYQVKRDNPCDCINEKIVLTGNFEDYPIEYVQSLLKDFKTIKDTYGHINKRNTKKTDAKLAKHMMHLIRLYLMGYDLNTRMEIVTYREKEHDMLMDIRNGKYMSSDGMKVLPEFYDLLHEVQDKYDYSVKHSILPAEPNYVAINDMLLDIYKELL